MLQISESKSFASFCQHPSTAVALQDGAVGIAIASSQEYIQTAQSEILLAPPCQHKNSPPQIKGDAKSDQQQ
jgi:hypothetical protein